MLRALAGLRRPLSRPSLLRGEPASFSNALQAAAIRRLSTTTEPPTTGEAPATVEQLTSKQRRLNSPQWIPGGSHKYAVPSSWLGAYYTLREGDPIAEKNRNNLKGKREPTRGRFIVQTLDQMEMQQRLAKEPWRKGEFRTGDYLEVEHRASLSDPVERTVGLVLARKRQGLASSVNLLCQIDGLAVEYRFMLFSPLLLSLEVRGGLPKRPRKSKIYNYRERLNDFTLPKPRRVERTGEARRGGKKK